MPFVLPLIRNADEITFSPVGGIAAADVQAAIAELDTEKVPYSGASGAIDLGSENLTTLGTGTLGGLTVKGAGANPNLVVDLFYWAALGATYPRIKPIASDGTPVGVQEGGLFLRGATGEFVNPQIYFLSNDGLVMDYFEYDVVAEELSWSGPGTVTIQNIEAKTLTISSGLGTKYIKIQKDSTKIYFGAEDDAYIMYDGNSLDIVNTDTGEIEFGACNLTTTGNIKGNDFEVDGSLNHDGSTVGFYGTIPAVQPAHIVDADGTLADITTKFNTLLAQVATLGLQAAA